MVQCPSCRYDMAGVPESDGVFVCPECGKGWKAEEILPRRTTLRAALFAGVVPWAVAAAMVIVLPAVMGPEAVGRWLRVVAWAAMGVSVVGTAVMLWRDWRTSIWFDRGCVVVIVGIANACGVVVLPVLGFLMEVAGV